MANSSASQVEASESPSTFEQVCRVLDNTVIVVQGLRWRVESVRERAHEETKRRLEERAKLLRCRVKDIRPQVCDRIDEQVRDEFWAPAMLASLKEFADNVRTSVEG